MKKILLITLALAGLASVGLAKIDTTGMVAFYPFIGNANDLSGHGNNGIESGATLTIDRFGSINNAYIFDGINDYIFVPDSQSLDLTTAATISIWVRPDTCPQLEDCAPLIGKGAPNADNYTISISGTPTDKLRFLFWQGGTLYTAIVNSWLTPAKVGKWLNIVSVYDGSTGVVKLFEDSLKIFESSGFPVSLDTSNTGLDIGSRSSTPGAYDYNFKGAIDDIRIFNRALSDSEVVSLYIYEKDPYIPLLITPTPDQLFAINTPTFLWRSIISANSYHLQISPFSNFASLTVDTIISDTTITSNALVNNWYYWRVKAYSATDSSDWSEVRSFSVATTTVGIPSLTFPPADTVTNDSFPDFDWADVAGATQYQLQAGRGNSWLYASNTGSGIRVVNISDIDHTEYLHNASLYSCTRLLVRDTLMLAVSSGGIYITSVADPYTVRHLSSYGRPSYDAALRDTLMFVASQSQGLRVVNLANPSAPAEVAACDSTAYVRAVELYGGRAYMLSGGYLKVVDISNPAAPAVLGTLPLTNAVDLAVSGNYVYAASQSTGLQVVDVSNPAAPVLQGSCYTAGNFQRLKVKGEYAYVAAVTGGLRVINLANPANPVEFGSYLDEVDAEDVVLTGPYACISGSNGNAKLLDVTNPYLPALAADVQGNTWNCDAIAVNDSFAAIRMDTVLAASACPADTFMGEGRHYWRARAGAGTWGDWSGARRFTLDTQKPSETWNSSPYHGQLINSAHTALDWNDIGDAYRYQVRLCRDSAFLALELDTMVSVGGCTLLTALGDGRHWWQVRAMDLSGNWAAWSDSTRFRLDSQAPGAPAGITANGGNPSPWTKTNSFSVSFTPAFDSTGAYRFYYKKGAEPSSDYDTTGYGWDAAPPIDNITALGSGVTPFYVWAQDTAGNLDHRNHATVSLRYDSIPPEGAAARANEFSRTTMFTVGWNAGSDQGGSGLNNRYWIKIKVNGGGWIDLNTNYTGTSYVHSGVQGSKYYFEVAALDSAGNSEAFVGAPECSTLVDNTITSPILVSPYNGEVRDSSATAFLWQRATAQAGSRLQCSYRSDFATLVKDTLLAADSLANLTLADSLYYWRVRGQNSVTDTGSWSPSRTLRIDTQSPAAPALALPSADSLLNDNTPQFSWGAVAGASNYHLVISPDSLFAAYTVDEVIDTTAYTIQVTLPDSSYYWRARAGDAAGNWSSYSARRKFTVDTKAPLVPALLSPGDNSTVTTNLPAFTWNKSSQAVQYRLQAAVNTSFSPAEMDTLCSDTSVAPLWGINDGTHYWRVRCRDQAGNWSAYSAYRTFNIDGLLQVALITPDTGSLWAPSQSVWIQFSKAIYTGSGYIDTTKFKIRGKHSAIVKAANLYWEPATSTLRVTPDTAFAANDTISVFISGTLRDYQNLATSTLDGNNDGFDAGDTADSYRMTFRTSLIGDYNADGLMNGPDLALFAWGWYNYSRYFEAGPFFGTWPHQKVYAGSATKLDFEDLMGLVYSWNRSGAAKYAPAKAGDPGPLILETSPDGGGEMLVKVKPGIAFSALDASITFDPAAGAGKVAASELWNSEGNPQLFLTRQTPGLTEISAAVWPGGYSSTGELFRFSLSETKGQAPVSLSYRLYDKSGEVLAEGSLSAALTVMPGLPAVFSFSPARPNPAGQATVISYQLPSEVDVRLDVYNIAGQVVATLAEGKKPAGYHAQTWDLKDSGGRRVANGVYLFRLKAGQNRGTGKMIVIR